MTFFGCKEGHADISPAQRNNRRQRKVILTEDSAGHGASMQGLGKGASSKEEGRYGSLWQGSTLTCKQTGRPRRKEC